MTSLKTIVESQWFSNAIMVLIVANAITLSLETSTTVMATAGNMLLAFDVVEIGRAHV